MLAINAGTVLDVDVHNVDVYELPPLQRCSTINDNIQIKSKPMKEKTEESNEESVVMKEVKK